MKFFERFTSTPKGTSGDDPGEKVGAERGEKDSVDDVEKYRDFYSFFGPGNPITVQKMQSERYSLEGVYEITLRFSVPPDVFLSSAIDKVFEDGNIGVEKARLIEAKQLFPLEYNEKEKVGKLQLSVGRNSLRKLTPKEIKRRLQSSLVAEAHKHYDNSMRVLKTRDDARMQKEIVD